jgi:hypothetical protein
MALSASYFETNFFVTGAAQTAANFSIPLNGSQPFSVTAWVKFASLQNPTDILVKSGVFQFGVQGHQAYVQIAGFPGLWSDGVTNPINQDYWHYLACVFTGNSLLLYIDGQLDCQAVVRGTGMTNANAFIIGNDLQGKLSSVRVYSSALSAAAVLQAMFQPDPQQGYVANFDFSSNPPVDRSGNNLPLTLSQGATVRSVVPAVVLGNTAYCQPIRDSNVNPGGTGNDAYSIQAWINLSNPNPTGGGGGVVPGGQAILVNQALDAQSGVALFLVYDNTAQAYRFASLRGQIGTASNTLVSNATVTYGQWVNVATTYDPATTTLSIYVNGQLDTSSTSFPTIPALASPDILLAGAVIGSQPASGWTFQGYIQSVDVWSICLTAAQVQQWQDGYPILETGLVAHYAFGFALPRNEATGTPVGLADRAEMGTQTQKAGAGQLGPVPIRRYAAEPPHAQLSAERMAEIRSTVSFNDVPNLDKLLEQAMERELAADLHAVVPPEMVGRLRNRLKAEWQRVRWQIRERPLEMRFAITYHQIDGDHVLIHHTPERSTVVFRTPLAALDDCTMWRIRVVWTVVSGLLSVLGITAQLTNRAMTFVQQRIIANQQLMNALTINPQITAMGVYLVLKTMHSFGVLWPLIKIVLTTLSWWALGRLLVKILVSVFGAPAAVAETIASLVVAVAQLIYVLTQQPAQCPLIPPTAVEDRKARH